MSYRMGRSKAQIEASIKLFLELKQKGISIWDVKLTGEEN